MAATYAKVKTEDQKKHRSLTDILEILEKSELVPQVRDRASSIFQRLGEAEARVHDVPVEKIHFHEVGAVDAIVDIVGACIGFQSLGIDKFACSPLNVGGGIGKNGARSSAGPGSGYGELAARQADILQRRAARTGHAHWRRDRGHAL